MKLLLFYLVIIDILQDLLSISLLTSTHSFTNVAHTVNLSVSTIIRIFDKLSYTSSELPEILSIDEFKGNTGCEKYQYIITDPAHRRVIDILPNRFKSHLTSYFLSFDTSKTTHFVSDIWQIIVTYQPKSFHKQLL